MLCYFGIVVVYFLLFVSLIPPPQNDNKQKPQNKQTMNIK